MTGTAYGMPSASAGMAIRVQQFHTPLAPSATRCVHGPPTSLALRPIDDASSCSHE